MSTKLLLFLITISLTKGFVMWRLTSSQWLYISYNGNYNKIFRVI